MLLQQIRSLFRPLVRARAQTARRILIVTDHLPLFDHASGCLRLKTIIDMLAEDGWCITFGSVFKRRFQPGVSGKDRARYEGALRAAGVAQLLYGPKRITQFIEKQGRNFEWCFLSRPDVAAHFTPLVRHWCPATRLIYDMVDFHGVRMERHAKLFRDSALLALAEKQHSVEVACAAAADITIAISDDEKATLLDAVPTAIVEVLPNIFDLPPGLPPGPKLREGLFFVGGFWHAPNGDAVCWFVERILPLIQRQMPNTLFSVAGANPGVKVMALSDRPGIKILGHVPDLKPLFNRHRVFVAPLRFGAGMKGKVGQSLIHGLPVVSTQVGAAGMGLENERHVLLAEDEQTFASQVLRLLRDDHLWRRLSVAGAKQIESTLSTDVIRPRLRAIFNRTGFECDAAEKR